MLYKRYAIDDFAKKGFDFSCISALYYQAFEDASAIYILIRLKDRADMPAVFRIKFKALFSEVSQFLLQKRQELPDMPPVHKGMVDKDREGDRDPVFFAYSAVDQA